MATTISSKQPRAVKLGFPTIPRKTRATAAPCLPRGWPDVVAQPGSLSQEAIENGSLRGHQHTPES